jgi:hypothetical protein
VTTVTVSGGPWTDGQGYPKTGVYGFQPFLTQVPDYLVPHGVEMTDTVPGERHDVLDDTGSFSTDLISGVEYTFTLTVAGLAIAEVVTVPSSNTTIEALLS